MAPLQLKKLIEIAFMKIIPYLFSKCKILQRLFQRQTYFFSLCFNEAHSDKNYVHQIGPEGTKKPMQLRVIL